MLTSEETKLQFFGKNKQRYAATLNRNPASTIYCTAKPKSAHLLRENAIRSHMSTQNITYRVGIPEQFRDRAAVLFEEAFGRKLAVAIQEREKRMRLLQNCMLLDHAVAAFSEDDLLGMAGFHTSGASLTGTLFSGGWTSLGKLCSSMGLARGLRAALIFSLYERRPKPGELLMDGIAVCSTMRGRGIGSELLRNIQSHAEEQGYTSIRLDVIDINPGAKKLYERMGFLVVKTDRFPFLRSILGFGGISTMEYPVKHHPPEAPCD